MRTNLTPREMEVLVLIAKGKTAREAAELLRIKRRTAEVHISSIIAKLNASNRTHAVALAFQRHLLKI